MPADFKELGQSLQAQLALVSNLFFWKGTGYFRGPSESKPLLHTWSLAIEEQFYVFLPLLLFLLPRKRFKACVVLLFVISFGPNLWLTPAKPQPRSTGFPSAPGNC